MGISGIIVRGCMIPAATRSDHDFVDSCQASDACATRGDLCLNIGVGIEGINTQQMFNMSSRYTSLCERYGWASSFKTPP
jgi:hypothetical protein